MITPQEVMALISSTLRIADLKADAEMGKVRGWDSIRQVRLVLSLEEATGIEVPPDMFGEITSVDAILDFLRDENALDGEQHDR